MPLMPFDSFFDGSKYVLYGSKGVEYFFRVDCKPILETEKDPMNSELSTVLELEIQNKRGQLVVATKTQHDPWGAGDLSWVSEDGTRLGLVCVSDQWGVKLDSFSLRLFRKVVTPLCRKFVLERLQDSTSMGRRMIGCRFWPGDDLDDVPSNCKMPNFGSPKNVNSLYSSITKVKHPCACFLLEWLRPCEFGVIATPGLQTRSYLRPPTQ